MVFIGNHIEIERHGASRYTHSQLPAEASELNGVSERDAEEVEGDCTG
jgi:hypothetical protein